MTLTQLRHFQAACLCKSVTKAAEYLYISQPSISNSVKELERELDIQLFDRKQRNLVVTSEGLFFLEQVNQILNNIDQLCEQMRNLRRNKIDFRIGVPPMAGMVAFHKIYQAFTQNYPQINVQITECGSLSACNMLVDNTLDIALATVNEMPDDRFHTMKLFESRLVFCVSPHHRLATHKELDIGNLSDEPIILFCKDSFPTYAIIKAFNKIGIKPTVLLSSNQISLIKQFIAGGTAGAFLLEEIACSDSCIISIPLKQSLAMNVILMWRNNKEISPHLSTFIDFVRGYHMTKA